MFIPALPLLGFLLLALGVGRRSRWLVTAVGVGSVALSALLATELGLLFGYLNPARANVDVDWGSWLSVGDFRPTFGLYLDALSLAMVLVITVIGLLILVYSSRYMAEDPGYRRFFAYMNLFVGSMLVLVLADNLLALYLGWEGVGLCSYLLIGFWYQDPANSRAAIKAFLVTRVGDAALAVGIALLFTQFHTLQISELLRRAPEVWPVGAPLAVAAAALLLAGAVAKSAQLPLQTWLPDAMAGPTPVSALIHAATMVTAGVYLIARMHALFLLAPTVLALVAVIGAVTLLLAGCAALVQRDLKRVLAYSTMSQVGYMFVALGVGAWGAAIFHLVTHACFKSLLFLAAGVVIASLGEERDLFRMGGLRRSLPVAFGTFVVGGLSLAAFPLITAGYFSKDLILYSAWTSPQGSVWLWGAGVVGALLTSLYIFRVIFLVFFGAQKRQPERVGGLALEVPLLILAALAVAAGWAKGPLTAWLATALPPVAGATPASEMGLSAIATVVSLAGMALAALLYFRLPARVALWAQSSGPEVVRRLWRAGWGFDWLYDRVFVRPVVWLARVNRGDVFDDGFRAAAEAVELASRILRRTQTGRLRWYAAGVALGAILLVALMVVRP
jgi:NADH-quinone oxidoreductase subunit L